MKLGVCTAPQNIHIAAQSGFDFIECALNWLEGLTDAAFDELAAQAASFPIPVAACNCLLPGTVRVTGAQASLDQAKAYLDRAFFRARQLGVGIAVFGSGGARNVPEPYPYAAAWRQIADFLRLAGDMAEKHGLTVAIEPLRNQECNVLNFVSEATALAALVDHPRVGVLGDSYHMLSGSEPWQALARAGALLKHTHISRALPDLSGRVFPLSGDNADELEMLRTLKQMNYKGAVSLEAGTPDFAADAGKAAALLRHEMDIA